MDLNDDDLADYVDLNVLLEHIERHQNGLFNFETLETDPKQWREFCGIVKHATTFKPGSLRY